MAQLVLYAFYLHFQLGTHSFLFAPKNQISPLTGIAAGDVTEDQAHPQPEEEEEPQMAPLAAGAVLLFVTVVTAFAADCRE